MSAIMYLAKQNNYTISKFEKEIGKSVGYLSRTIKDNADIGFNTISQCAKVLGYDTTSSFMTKLEDLSQEKNCPICKGTMKIYKGQYVCNECGVKIEYAKGSDEE